MMTIARYFEADGEAREDYLGSLSAEELLQLGIDLYNAGHYWNAHEAWEEVWMDCERGLRNFYQGLIQVTAAFVHITRGRYPGGERLLASGIAKLELYRPDMMGLDLGSFLEQARKAYAAVAALGEARINDFDLALVPRLRAIQGTA